MKPISVNGNAWWAARAQVRGNYNTTDKALYEKIKAQAANNDNQGDGTVVSVDFGTAYADWLSAMRRFAIEQGASKNDLKRLETQLQKELGVSDPAQDKLRAGKKIHLDNYFQSFSKGPNPSSANENGQLVSDQAPASGPAAEAADSEPLQENPPKNASDPDAKTTIPARPPKSTGAPPQDARVAPKKAAFRSGETRDSAPMRRQEPVTTGGIRNASFEPPATDSSAQTKSKPPRVSPDSKKPLTAKAHSAPNSTLREADSIDADADASATDADSPNSDADAPTTDADSPNSDADASATDADNATKHQESGSSWRDYAWSALDIGSSVGAGIVGTSLGAAKGVAIGSMFPIVGPVVGGIVGGILGSALGSGLASGVVNVARQVEKDDKVDWGDAGKHAAIGTATGLVGGAAGGVLKLGVGVGAGVLTKAGMGGAVKIAENATAKGVGKFVAQSGQRAVEGAAGGFTAGAGESVVQDILDGKQIDVDHALHRGRESMLPGAVGAVALHTAVKGAGKAVQSLTPRKKDMGNIYSKAIMDDPSMAEHLRLLGYEPGQVIQPGNVQAASPVYKKLQEELTQLSENPDAEWFDGSKYIKNSDTISLLEENMDAVAKAVKAVEEKLAEKAQASATSTAAANDRKKKQSPTKEATPTELAAAFNAPHSRQIMTSHGNVVGDHMLQTARTIAVGDVGGNPSSIIDTALRAGIVKMPVETARKFRALDNELQEIIKSDPILGRDQSAGQAARIQKEMTHLLSQIESTGSDQRLILLGDTVADRANSVDQVMLATLDALRKAHPKTITMASNHDLEGFIRTLPAQNRPFIQDPGNNKWHQSQTITHERAIRIAEVAGDSGAKNNLLQAYQNHFKETKLLSYDPDTNTLWAHANLTPRHMQQLISSMQEQGINVKNYDEIKTPQDIANFVTQANIFWQQIVEESIQNGALSPKHADLLVDVNNGGDGLLWARVPKDSNQRETPFGINYGHGHDGTAGITPASNGANVIGLNSYAGTPIGKGKKDGNQLPIYVDVADHSFSAASSSAPQDATPSKVASAVGLQKRPDKKNNHNDNSSTKRFNPFAKKQQQSPRPTASPGGLEDSGLDEYFLAPEADYRRAASYQDFLALLSTHYKVKKMEDPQAWLNALVSFSARLDALRSKGDWGGFSNSHIQELEQAIKSTGNSDYKLNKLFRDLLERNNAFQRGETVPFAPELYQDAASYVHEPSNRPPLMGTLGSVERPPEKPNRVGTGPEWEDTSPGGASLAGLIPPVPSVNFLHETNSGFPNQNSHYFYGRILARIDHEISFNAKADQAQLATLLEKVRKEPATGDHTLSKETLEELRRVFPYDANATKIQVPEPTPPSSEAAPSKVTKPLTNTAPPQRFGLPSHDSLQFLHQKNLAGYSPAQVSRFLQERLTQEVETGKANQLIGFSISAETQQRQDTLLKAIWELSDMGGSQLKSDTLKQLQTMFPEKG